MKILIIIIVLTTISDSSVAERQMCNLMVIQDGPNSNLAQVIATSLVGSVRILTLTRFKSVAQFGANFWIQKTYQDFCLNFLLSISDEGKMVLVLNEIVRDILFEFVESIVILSDSSNLASSVSLERLFNGKIYQLYSNGTQTLINFPSQGQLCGAHLRDCEMTVTAADYSIPSLTSDGKGYALGLMNILASHRNIRLAETVSFDSTLLSLFDSYTFSLDPSRQWGGMYPNGTFYGAVGGVARREVDLSISGFSCLYSRSKVRL